MLFSPILQLRVIGVLLGKLRQFLNETCQSLPNNTPIMISCSIGENSIVPCIQVLADEESVELYNF